jgi:hypothetical protein
MRLFRLGLVACLAAALLGCSKDRRGNVTGAVSYKDQPVKAGTIYFVYEQAGQYQAEIKSDGTYQFMDVPTGAVKVVIQNEMFNPEQRPVSYTQKQKQLSGGYGKGLKEYDAQMGRGTAVDKRAAAQQGPGLSKEKKEELAKVYVKLPKKYTSEKSTPLTYTVETGRQTKDLNLTD